MLASEALSFGLVSRICTDHADLIAQAKELAELIASKSPAAVLGVKTLLNFTRDHSVQDSLRFGLTWNAAMLQSPDVKAAGVAFITKQKPVFGDPPPVFAKSKL
jgi:enoyl-CoA hydratase